MYSSQVYISCCPLLDPIPLSSSLPPCTAGSTAKLTDPAARPPATGPASQTYLSHAYTDRTLHEYSLFLGITLFEPTF